MPNGQQAAYDYTQDPEFLRAPIAQQHAFLVENDADYAQADQRSQNRYLSHLREQAGSPVAPQTLADRMQQTDIFGQQVTPLTRKQSNLGNTGAASGVFGASALLNPAAAVRGAVKSAAGRVAGKYGGRAIGGDTGEKWGEAAGTVIGPLIGGKTFAKIPGIGGMAASDADIAAVQTERKLAQRIADEAAGLRKPTDPFAEKLPLPQRAYAEMQSDIGSERLARSGAYDEMQRNINAERLGRAGARQEMYGDLAQARAGRTGDVATEGQQTGGYGGSYPDPSEFYSQRGANLSSRIGDVATEGQQSGGFGAPFPEPPDSLTQAISEGRAGKVPVRMPRTPGPRATRAATEARAASAGIWTPQSAAEQGGLWSAGSGDIPNPVRVSPENIPLVEKIRRLQRGQF